MEENHLHRRSFRLRYDDVDGKARAKPVALLNLLEETAASHCESTGWGIFRLLSEGFGWVLLRGAFEMLRYPRYREEVVIETWASSAHRFRAEREYRILSPGGEPLGFARGLWLFCNLATRRPATIFDDYLRSWKPGGSPAGPLPLDEVDGPPVPEPSAGARHIEVVQPKAFDVRLAEIDTNGHVNNAVYLSWALEAIPAHPGEDLVLRRIVAQWKREITFGVKVRPRCVEEAGGHIRLGVFAEPQSSGGTVSRATTGAADTAAPSSHAESGTWLAAAAESTWVEASA
jgi:acyl-ACP thioesterase